MSSTSQPLALIVLTAAGLSTAALHAQDIPKSTVGKEKCYGVAKAGENGCQSLSGAHTCGGCSKVDYSGENWKWVPTGTCRDIGGQLSAFQGFGVRAASASIPKTPSK